MKKKIKYSILVVIILLIGILFYELLWGKLFPYSPVIIGFSKHEMSNTIIYVQNGADYTDFTKIDTLTPPVEQFHQLRFLQKPEIFIFRDSLSYIHRSVSRARFYAFYDRRVFISPWAVRENKEGIISLEIYLKHELSHTLLLQNMGILNAYRSPRWFLEGIAVYSVNQMGTSWYPAKQETYRLIKLGNFMPPEYFDTKKEDQVRLNVKYRMTFIYSEFACIVDYIIMNYGKEKFMIYMKSLLKNSNHDEVFKQVYGISFNNLLMEFKNHVNTTL
ncbi:MAG: hypothetical protein P4L27_02410 [Ignavibacteriaceae bacterium]|nr:hypothetical protein [Ignavibacteriaceae bacterium]